MDFILQLKYLLPWGFDKSLRTKFYMIRSKIKKILHQEKTKINKYSFKVKYTLEQTISKKIIIFNERLYVFCRIRTQEHFEQILKFFSTNSLIHHESSAEKIFI